jgi:colanic acid/amylovoran biosynthesis glycosyltransferase
MKKSVANHELVHKKRVIYSIDNYLDITANWIYFQMKSMVRYKPVVFCTITNNISNFPYEPIYSLSNLPTGQRLYNKVIKKVTRTFCYQYHNKLVAKLEPLLIHSHFGMRGYADLELKRKYGIPLITSFYGIDATMIPEQDPRWLDRYSHLFEMGDLFLVEAPNMKKILIRLGCNTDKIKVQSLGIDIDKIKYKKRIRKEGKLNVLIASSFREKKGIPDSLEVIGRLRKELGNFTVTIVGGVVNLPSSQEEERRIHQTIDKYGLHDYIVFKGFMDHSSLIDEAYRHDVFFATSKRAESGDTEGGTNIVILEMAASGLPIMATKHCDFHLTMGDENRKYLAEEGIIESIIERFRMLLNADWVSIGRENRNYIKSRYNMRNQISHLESIYDHYCLKH